MSVAPSFGRQLLELGHRQFRAAHVDGPDEHHSLALLGHGSSVARWTANVDRMGRKSFAVVAVLAVVFALGGCAREARSAQPVTVAPEADKYGPQLRQGLSTDAMMAHLQKLQDIANANNGTRAVGTPGYEASVDYVANTLRNKVSTCRPRSSTCEPPIVTRARLAQET